MDRRDFLTLTAFSPLAGCTYFREAKTPMDCLRFAGKPSTKGKHLVLFLPGLGDTPGDVVAGGMVEEMSLAPQFDCVIADAHIGYYSSGTFRPRILEDLILPIRPQYDEFWIVGTSMGGYGAVAIAAERPDLVTGAILLAPYLGEAPLIESIEAAGSLNNWDPATAPHGTPKDDHARHVWTWLKEHAGSAKAPLIFQGSGDRDPHMRALRLISPGLAPGRTLVVAGGHTWTAWRTLFHMFMERELMFR